MTAPAALRVRDAAEGDVDHVSRIEVLAFGDPWSRSAFTSLFGHAHVVFLVAEACSQAPHGDGRGARGEIAGYTVAWFSGEEAEIANIAVAPTLRARGIGARLLDAALAEVTRRGAASVYLEVRESNAAARRLYASRGFVEIGRRRNYYRRPLEDALVMRRDRVLPDDSRVGLVGGLRSDSVG
ncbi:MAG: ribosomal protein S18-alanine N-acetyltransferase [Gemmatirosa sp.]|nr:ribosomal protein S18-alanine N-acetyltransferase [Gemmatirosa sp.]